MDRDPERQVVEVVYASPTRQQVARVPLTEGLTRRHARAFSGGVGIISTLIALGLTAAYLPPTMLQEPSARTPELSRRARGVEVWAVLRSLGRSGVADLVERDCRFASAFASGLSAAGYEILNEVELNQVLVSFGDEEKTRRVVAAIQEDGTCWAGVTVWQGRTALRISVSGWSTTDEDVERSLAAILRAAAAV